MRVCRSDRKWAGCEYRYYILRSAHYGLMYLYRLYILCGIFGQVKILFLVCSTYVLCYAPMFYWRIDLLEAMFIATHFQDLPHTVVWAIKK